MSIKVLVADDSITIQKVIGIIFSGDDYSLTVVDNGTAAIDKARELIPDILLIDAQMPGMTGCEVARLVRSTPALAAKPILILTGSFEPFDEEKARECGADGFIAKPFESQQIVTKVHELLELGRSRDQSTDTSPSFSPSETLIEQPSEVSAPVFDTPTPFFAQQTDFHQSTAPTDIWGAFTPETTPPIESTEQPAVATASTATIPEPDVFSIVTEETDQGLVLDSVATDISYQQTGSQWVSVEESTLEFEEEVPLPPASSSPVHATPVWEASVSSEPFETIEETPFVPPFSSVPEPDFSINDYSNDSFTMHTPDTVDPVPDNASARAAEPPPPPGLTEEQLKAAIASASKDVIERIVWEVVPDLAEAMIREAIRQIKEEN